MSKFNQNSPSVNTPTTINAAGGRSFKLGTKESLVNILLTSLAEDSYYESAGATEQRLLTLVNEVDPLFAAKAAIYARDVFGMRSVTHITAAALAKQNFAEKRKFYANVVIRPDDALEILSKYWATQPKAALPNAMKRGFADRISGFSAYQLMKYKAEGKNLNMFDLINLVHPKSEAVNSFMKGELTPADTWEVALSTKGASAATWRALVLEEKLGIMALLRNLRNIVDYCRHDTEVMNAVYRQLTNRRQILMSRLFPYRFLAAYQTFMEDGFGIRRATAPQALLTALNKAAEISLDNVPELTGSSAIILDISASMENRMSGKSKMRMVDAGAMLAAMLYKKNPDSELVKFGDRAKNLRINADMPILEIAKAFAKNDGLGHGTNLTSAFESLSRKHERVIIVSDMQTWADCNSYYMRRTSRDGYNDYCKKFNIRPYAYEINLSSYGTSALNDADPKVFHLSTITDKIFPLMSALETGGNSLVEEIEKVII